MEYISLYGGINNELHQSWIVCKDFETRLSTYKWSVLKSGKRGKSIIYVDIKYSPLRNCDYCGYLSGKNKVQLRCFYLFTHKTDDFRFYDKRANYCCFPCIGKMLALDRKLNEIKKCYELLGEMNRFIKNFNKEYKNGTAKNRNSRPVASIPMHNADRN